MALQYTKPKGTQDFYGKSIEAWQYVEKKIAEICREFGVSEIRTPMFESTDLFIRGVGETTDIVQKEMFTFQDAGGRSLTLRPEGTASAVRAYLENGIANEPQPAKLYYISPNFRAERPQKGRYRQFHQFGVEYFGSESPRAEAEVISIFYTLMQRLNIPNITLKLNSLGGNECRTKYNEILKLYIGQNLDSLCETCRERFEKNPLRVLDCKTDGCKAIMSNAPSSVDCLDTECREHFDEVCRLLSVMGISFEVDSKIVRGLDYYTRTVFEFLTTDLGSQAAVCAGGRYDNLIKDCGGAKTGAVGFGAGIDRLCILLEDKGLLPAQEQKPSFYIGSTGDKSAEKAMETVYTLRKKGILAECDIVERSVKAQMKYADKMGVKYVVILGDSEIESGICKAKEMATGTEIEIPVAELAEKLYAIKMENYSVMH